MQMQMHSLEIPRIRAHHGGPEVGCRALFSEILPNFPSAPGTRSQRSTPASNIPPWKHVAPQTYVDQYIRAHGEADSIQRPPRKPLVQYIHRLPQIPRRARMEEHAAGETRLPTSPRNNNAHLEAGGE